MKYLIFLNYNTTERMNSNKGLEMNDYEQAMRVSSVFYNRYKSLCHGTSRRH